MSHSSTGGMVAGSRARYLPFGGYRIPPRRRKPALTRVSPVKNTKNRRLKIVCRYQPYDAANQMVQNGCDGLASNCRGNSGEEQNGGGAGQVETQEENFLARQLLLLRGSNQRLLLRQERGASHCRMQP